MSRPVTRSANWHFRLTCTWYRAPSATGVPTPTVESGASSATGRHARPSAASSHGPQPPAPQARRAPDAAAPPEDLPLISESKQDWKIAGRGYTQTPSPTRCPDVNCFIANSKFSSSLPRRSFPLFFYTLPVSPLVFPRLMRTPAGCNGTPGTLTCGYIATGTTTRINVGAGVIGNLMSNNFYTFGGGDGLLRTLTCGDDLWINFYSFYPRHVFDICKYSWWTLCWSITAHSHVNISYG